MNIAKAMKWSNGLLFISAVIQTLTGALLFFNIDPVIIVVNNSDIHKYNGALLAALTLFHISLNWSWFKAHYKPR